MVRHAEIGEKLTTLDDVVRPLEPDDLLITDDSGPIGLAGVMGGATTELSPATSTVVIEAAHFDAMTIARASRRHKLSSEASRRFERGVDPAATYAAAHRVAQLLVELAGGDVGERRDGRRLRAAAAPATMAADLSARVLGAADRGRPGRRLSARRSASTSRRTAPLRGHAAELAPRSA